ncbi:MAG TPA: sugar phosphate isomerase/epimerase family protein [Phycisphaerae bacterium]|nr:sugar phosphate isomerase/epimerase family protein [Phycisphaerae bacterium]
MFGIVTKRVVGVLMAASGLLPVSVWAGGAATKPAPASADFRPRVAVQTYVWAQDRAAKKLDFWADLGNVFIEVAASGATHVEGFLDWFDTDAKAHRAQELLKQHALTLVGAYAGGVFHEEAEARKTIDVILKQADRAKQRCGKIFIDVNPQPLPNRAAKSEAQLAVQVAMLNLLGHKLADKGMSLVVHQHDAEILNDAKELRYHIAHLEAKVVGLCLDTHWVYRGGQDPLTLLMEAGRKVRVLHLRNSVNGIWTESLGPGDVDYAAIANHLRQSGYNGWLIIELAYEQGTKVTRPLSENVKSSRHYLEQVFIKGS